MNPEIEKLIELTLIDGQLSEKERVVIINKAISLGIEQDEIEVIIEGKLQQIQATNLKPNKEKIGNIKTCPACGASIKSMKMSCYDCGHEFTNIEATKSVVGLLNRINALQRTQNEKENVFNQRKAEVINNTAIPNSKEDLIEFLTICSSQSRVLFSNRGYGKVLSAWSRKGYEALSKGKLLFKDDPNNLKIIEGFQNKLLLGKLVSYITVKNIIILFILIRLVFMFFE
jgi:hypothetical protein